MGISQYLEYNLDVSHIGTGPALVYLKLHAVGVCSVIPGGGCSVIPGGVLTLAHWSAVESQGSQNGCHFEDGIFYCIFLENKLYFDSNFT